MSVSRCSLALRSSMLCDTTKLASDSMARQTMTQSRAAGSAYESARARTGCARGGKRGRTEPDLLRLELLEDALQQPERDPVGACCALDGSRREEGQEEVDARVRLDVEPLAEVVPQEDDDRVDHGREGHCASVVSRRKHRVALRARENQDCRQDAGRGRRGGRARTCLHSLTPPSTLLLPLNLPSPSSTRIMHTTRHRRA